VYAGSSNGNKATAASAQGNGSLESLEGRRLLSSVAIDDGSLVIYGNKTSSNELGVYRSGSNLVAFHNGDTRTIDYTSVSRIFIYGSSDNDKIWITPEVTKAAVIRGYAGDDVLYGGGGNEWIYGGKGNDRAWGNRGNDFVSGGDGTDQLWGGTGRNEVDGGAGTDEIHQDSSGGGSTPSEGGSDDDGGGDSNADSPNADITAQRTSIMAGQAIHVHATDSSLGEGSPQNAMYRWDFGDDGSSYNSLHGFNAAHYYAQPGTYTIKLTVTNQAGKSDTTSITVKVAPNTRERIYVSESGDDSNPGTQSRPIRSFNRAAQLADEASNVEVLFRRGDTFNASIGFAVKGDNVVIGAYGSGDRPVIRWTANVDGYPTIISPRGDNITVQDLTFTSSTSNPPQAIRPSGNNVTVRGNEFKTLGYAVNANGRPNGLLVQGNSAPEVGGIESYFVWSEGTDHVFLGNYVRNSREEHAIRVVGADRVLVWGNNLTNTTGEVSGDNTPKGALTLHHGSYYWVARNQLNDGPVAIGPLGNGDGMAIKDARFRYGVIDGNTFDTKLAVDHGAERIMVRNNIINSRDTAILVEGYNSSYGRTTNDVTIVNNTVVNYEDSGRFVTVEDGAKGVTLANNLYVAPNLFAGAGATASVYVEDSGLGSFKFIGNNVWANAKSNLWAEGGQNYVWPSWSNSSGYRSASEWNGLSGVATDHFSDVSINDNYAPGGSSTAASAGRWIAGVFHDRYGKARSGSTWTAGAIEL
jgi:PKD repeat protein